MMLQAVAKPPPPPTTTTSSRRSRRKSRCVVSEQHAINTSGPLATRRSSIGLCSLCVLDSLLASTIVPRKARSETVITESGRGNFFSNFVKPEFMDARQLVQRGMRHFLDGEVEESVDDFDSALQLDASYKPRLWQRGLSLYYTESYAEAAEQFRCDVQYNPNDTEEALWTYLSEAQSVGPEDARKMFLEVGTDPRPLLRTVYDVYRSEETKNPDEILEVARRTNSPHDEFYANLYVALWYESVGKESMAKEFMLAAVDTVYALKSGDYMCGLAEVHCKVRNWI